MSDFNIASIVDVEFNLNHKQHLKLIEDKTESFNKALAELQTCDRRIVSGMVLGGSCWVGSYIFPLVTAGMAGVGFGMWHMSKREALHKHYRETFADLLAVYHWSMGADTGNHWLKLGNPSLQNMIESMASLVPAAELCTWRMEDLQERNFFWGQSARKDIPEICVQLLNNKASKPEGLSYFLYGKTGTSDVWKSLQNHLFSNASPLMNLPTEPRP